MDIFFFNKIKIISKKYKLIKNAIIIFMKFNSKNNLIIHTGKKIIINSKLIKKSIFFI